MRVCFGCDSFATNHSNAVIQGYVFTSCFFDAVVITLLSTSVGE